MYLIHQQLDPLISELKAHSDLSGNVGRKIRRFLAQVMPGNMLSIDLTAPERESTAKLLEELPLALPNLFARAHGLIDRLVADNEFVPEKFAVSAEVFRPKENPLQLILNVRIGHSPVELLSLRELVTMCEVAGAAAARCKQLLDRICDCTPDQLGALGMDLSEHHQDLARQIAESARDHRALPPGMTPGKLPVSTLHILEAYGMEDIAAAALVG